METITEKTTPTVEETAPSASTLFADESAVATAEEAAAETTSATVDPAGETPAAAEETAPVAPVAGETPAETPTTEEPTTETPTETTPVAPDAGETPSTSDEAELPSGIGDESIGGTERTAERARTRIGKALEDFKGFVKKHPIMTFAVGTVLVLGMFAGILVGAIYGVKVNNKVDSLAASNANNGGNNTSIDVPVDHDAEAISKGKSTIDSVLAAYPGEYTNEGENFIQNNGTSTTVYYKMKNKSNGKTIILSAVASGVTANTYDDYYKQLGDMKDSELFVTIGGSYESVDSYKEGNPASAEAIDNIVSKLNAIYGEGGVFISKQTALVDDGSQMSARFYIEGQGDKIGFSEFREKNADAESNFIKNIQRTLNNELTDGSFAVHDDVDPSFWKSVAEINKPVEQPSTPAEGETGAEAEDPNASI